MVEYFGDDEEKTPTNKAEKGGELIQQSLLEEEINLDQLTEMSRDFWAKRGKEFRGFLLVEEEPVDN